MPKDRLVVILAGLSLILFIFNIGSCISSYSQGSGRKKEMAQRMSLEEEMIKSTQEKAVLLKKLEAKDEEYQSTKKALAQEQLVGQSLKDELQKETKLEQVLREDLKEASEKNKKAKK